MLQKSKIALAVFVALALVAVPCGGALAQEEAYSKDRDPGAMTGDLVLTRPLGLAATVAGAAVFLVSIPFSALGGNTGQAWQKLVVDPVNYTFNRPLGEF